MAKFLDTLLNVLAKAESFKETLKHAGSAFDPKIPEPAREKTKRAKSLCLTKGDKNNLSKSQNIILDNHRAMVLFRHFRARDLDAEDTKKAFMFMDYALEQGVDVNSVFWDGRYAGDEH